MILAFEPPPELTELVWRAAQAAAIVVNRELDELRRQDQQRYGRLPVVVPTQVVGSMCLRPVCRARRIMSVLVRRHVFYERHDSGGGSARVVIQFGETLYGKFKPLSTTMLGFLINHDHSTFSAMANVITDPTFAARVDAAERELSTMYLAGATIRRISCTATFRGRMYNRTKRDSDE